MGGGLSSRVMDHQRHLWASWRVVGGLEYKETQIGRGGESGLD